MRIVALAILCGALLLSSCEKAPNDRFQGYAEGEFVYVSSPLGGTLKALAASRGEAVLAMSGGRVARELLEQASTDLRAIFRKGEGSVAITCLLGVGTLRDGVATIAPLRLRTPDATLIGGGQIDLVKQRVDLTVKSEDEASIFALGVPLHVTGGFAKVAVEPALGSSASWLDAPQRNEPTRRLAPALQPLAARNPCLR